MPWPLTVRHGSARAITYQEQDENLEQDETAFRVADLPQRRRSDGMADG
jgi:hypothetical protein